MIEVTVMEGKWKGNGPGDRGQALLTEDKYRIQSKEQETCPVEQMPDQQKLAEIEEALARSLRSHVRVTVVCSGPSAEKIRSGFVTSIHAHSRELKLQWSGDSEWIRVDDIVEVRFS
ncbi:YolD-like family protein [Paenibacillus tengchongensis]|uniref:YolD-like family protein n=1 Tax=Paenibacillus tengchongensis TaxID=2608684 RepID=UPI00124EDA1E|nr:YolD-like family protein [Paenibacillus tengchongensis]